MQATHQQQRPAGQAQQHAPDPAALLEQVMANTTAAQKTKLLSDSLSKRIETIRDLLPEAMQDQAARFVKRAALYFSASPQLEKCTTQSFIACVLKGAELGLAIDGRLAHAVPYNNKKKDKDGKEYWANEAQFSIDYKGLLAVARRSKIIKDCYARLVYENDEFDATDEDDACRLFHREHRGGDKGPVIGAFAKIILHGGIWRFEWMDVADIDKIRQRSKAKGNGPWVTDLGEMQKKGLALDTPIPTPEGWSTMGDLEVGDWVFDGNGDPTRVTEISDVKNIDCYAMTFSNRDKIVCDDEHRWPASIGKHGARSRERHGWAVYPIRQLYDAKKSGQIISVPVAGSLKIDSPAMPVDPWLLGLWLGDGHCRAASLSCHEDDVGEVVGRIAGSDYAVGTIRHDPRSKCVNVRIRDGFLADLRSLNLLRNKHVPPKYLRSNEADRRDLLCGLMDSDGCIDNHRGTAIFANTNSNLADAVAELATSMGEVVNRNSRNCHGFGTIAMAHRVCWQPTSPPVALARKLERFRPRKVAPYRGVASIEKVPSVPTKCIAVESETHTYLAGRSMIVTHNTVLRRALKTYCEDPGISALMEYDQGDDGSEETTSSAPTLPLNRTSVKGMNGRVFTQEDPGDQLSGNPGELAEGEIQDPAPMEPNEAAAEIEKFEADINLAATVPDLEALRSEIMRHAGLIGLEAVNRLHGLIQERIDRRMETASPASAKPAAKKPKGELPFEREPGAEG